MKAETIYRSDDGVQWPTSEQDAIYQLHEKVRALRAALPADAPQEGKLDGTL